MFVVNVFAKSMNETRKKKKLKTKLFKCKAISFREHYFLAISSAFVDEFNIFLSLFLLASGLTSSKFI